MEREVKIECGWNSQDADAIVRVGVLGLDQGAEGQNEEIFHYLELGIAVTEDSKLVIWTTDVYIPLI